MTFNLFDISVVESKGKGQIPYVSNAMYTRTTRKRLDLLHIRA